MKKKPIARKPPKPWRPHKRHRPGLYEECTLAHLPGTCCHYGHERLVALLEVLH